MESPGGNATGITSLDPGQAAAQMELLKEAAPRVRHVAILSDAGIPGADATGLAPIDHDNVSAAAALDLVASVVKLQGPTPDLERTFGLLAQEGVDAIVALEVPAVLLHAQRIARLAASRRMVSVFPGGTASAGAVLTYGTTVIDTWKRMPAIADRIAKGTPPARIPVERITRRELVVNLAAARALGLELPAVVTRRADTSIVD
jgi:putative ABC transport system substrate-binding protein